MVYQKETNFSRFYTSVVDWVLRCGRGAKNECDFVDDGKKGPGLSGLIDWRSWHTSPEKSLSISQEDPVTAFSFNFNVKK